MTTATNPLQAAQAKLQRRDEIDPLAEAIDSIATPRTINPDDPIRRAMARYEAGLMTSQIQEKASAATPAPATVTAVTEVVPANVRTSGHLIADLEFSDSDRVVAHTLNIDFDGSVQARVSRAISAINQAARLAVEAGYLLLQVKSEIGHGDFGQVISAAGLQKQRASEMMRMAKLLTLAPVAQRTRLLEMPKSKVVELASADQAVVEVLLEEGQADKIDALTVRELRAEIASLKKGLTDVTVQRDAAEADALALRRKQNAAGQRGRTDGLPIMVADMRAELLALQEKARLALATLGEQARAIDGLRGSALDQWAEPTAQLGLAALCALQVQVHAALEAWFDAAGMQGQTISDNLLTRLTPDEVIENARAFSELSQVHTYEAALRRWEREQAAPKGKGRPAAKPLPPAALREAD